LEIIVVCSNSSSSSNNNYMYVEFVSLPLATQKDPICIGDPTTIRTSPVVVAAVVTERERERERGFCSGGAFCG
jgi:hypothetical protein